MIVVTGSQGFIGTNLVNRLKNDGYDVIGVDSVNAEVTIADFANWWAENIQEIDFVIHLGAITDTLCMDKELFNCYNVNFSKIVWFSCFLDKIPLIYASSAATYGLGENGFSDKSIKGLKPLNPYGESKQEFDEFTTSVSLKPPHWYGLKFFNVYGPHEEHKGRMASFVHQVNKVMDEGKQVTLFDGPYRRDFIHVDDVVEVILWLMHKKPEDGIYNVGTGVAESFENVVRFLYEAKHQVFELQHSITYIPTPEDIMKQYQGFTKADVNKLRTAGYNKPFLTLREGVKKFVEYENSHIAVQSEA